MEPTSFDNIKDMFERQLYMETPEFHCCYQVILMMIHLNIVCIDETPADAQGDLIRYIRTHAVNLRK